MRSYLKSNSGWRLPQPGEPADDCTKTEYRKRGPANLECGRRFSLDSPHASAHDGFPSVQLTVSLRLVRSL
jgi:hypothetical protein